MSSPVVSPIFRSFERSRPPREIQRLDWNLSLILQCLSQPPFEPLKLASDKHLTWKTSFSVALASTKRASELHCLSFCVRHSRSWRPCTFSFLTDFVAKTQNPFVPDSRFDDLLIPSLDNFVDSDRDELLLIPVRALCKYLPGLSNILLILEGLFISTGTRSKRVSRNTIYFWLWSVIFFAHSLLRRRIVVL